MRIQCELHRSCISDVTHITANFGIESSQCRSRTSGDLRWQHLFQSASRCSGWTMGGPKGDQPDVQDPRSSRIAIPPWMTTSWLQRERVALPPDALARRTPQQSISDGRTRDLVVEFDSLRETIPFDVQCQTGGDNQALDKRASGITLPRRAGNDSGNSCLHSTQRLDRCASRHSRLVQVLRASLRWTGGGCLRTRRR